MVYAPFYTRLPLTNSVRNDPGLFCQGCARSVPTWSAPPCIWIEATSCGENVAARGSRSRTPRAADGARTPSGKQPRGSFGTAAAVTHDRTVARLPSHVQGRLPWPRLFVE